MAVSERKREYMRRYWQKHKVRRKAQSVAASRLKRTGYTQAEYDAALIVQHGVCKLCGNPDPNKALAADHNHTTGAKRGLLCQTCNIGLGSFKDNTRLLELAIKYLQENG